MILCRCPSWREVSEYGLREPRLAAASLVAVILRQSN
jgi:hypothetical protein